VQDPPKRSGAATCWESRQNSLHLVRRHLVLHLRFVTGPSQSMLREDTRQIDESARDGRPRDPAAGRRVLWVIRRTRCVVTPGTRRFTTAIISGRGADPLSRPQTYAAARAIKSDRSPHASTAARYRASMLGAQCPTRYTPRYW
jgi:hypothetical protein